jgi:hypothetical protein
MENAELVLRFFALRHIEQCRRKIKDFLDLYMMKSLSFTDEDIEVLKILFLETLRLGNEIYGKHLFKPFDAKKNDWKEKPSQACYDAVMVGLSQHLERSEFILKNRLKVIEETKKLFTQSEVPLFTEFEATQEQIKQSIQLFSNMLFVSAYP